MSVNSKFLYAWCCEDTGNDGGLGILALTDHEKSRAIALVATTLSNVERFKDYAQDVAKQTGKDVKLIKFERFENLDVVKGSH